MQRKSTLSVLVPNYNHGHYLEGYVTNLLQQSRPPDEVIVVDDASTDNSLEVLRKIAGRDSRVRWFQNERNLGVVGTLNRALHEATGEYVYGGAADDGVVPGAFEKAMRLLEQHPEAGLCFGYTLSLNHQTGSICENPIFLTKVATYLAPDEVAEAMNRIAVPAHAQDVPGNAAIWKRNEHLRTGGYRGALRWHADWFALQVVALRSGACFIPEPLAVTRIDHASFSRSGRYDWDRQKIVLGNVLELLFSDEFRDVLPRFQKGKLLSQFAPWIVRLIVSEPKYWDRDHALLIENSLLHFYRKYLHHPDPAVRQGTCACLGHLGRSSRKLLLRLALVSRDRNPDVRREATLAHERICGPRSPRLLPIHRFVGQASRSLRRISLRMFWRKIRPIAAKMYQLINYRMYARMAVLEESLAALIREHAGQLEELRLEISRMERQLQMEPGALNGRENGPGLPLIAFGDDFTRSKEPSEGPHRPLANSRAA